VREIAFARIRGASVVAAQVARRHHAKGTYGSQRVHLRAAQLIGADTDVYAFTLRSAWEVKTVRKDVSRIGPTAVVRVVADPAALAWVRPFRFVWTRIKVAPHSSEISYGFS